MPSAEETPHSLSSLVIKKIGVKNKVTLIAGHVQATAEASCVRSSPYGERLRWNKSRIRLRTQSRYKRINNDAGRVEQLT